MTIEEFTAIESEERRAWEDFRREAKLVEPFAAKWNEAYEKLQHAKIRREVEAEMKTTSRNA